jgi:hypothetical protein
MVFKDSKKFTTPEVENKNAGRFSSTPPARLHVVGTEISLSV